MQRFYKVDIQCKSLLITGKSNVFFYLVVCIIKKIFLSVRFSPRLLARVVAPQVFSREEETSWQCRECGHIHFGKEAPKACPACLHPQAYFEVEKQNY